MRAWTYGCCNEKFAQRHVWGYNVCMALISTPTTSFEPLLFVFHENDLLLAPGPHSLPLGLQSLPSELFFRTCIEQHRAADWFSETELHYSAMILKTDSVLPDDCEVISLRQFFWDSKTDSEQTGGISSSLGNLAARAHGFLRLRQQYWFCPACGTELVVHEKEIAKVCPSCGRLDFPRIEPAIIVLVERDDGAILLVKSKNRANKFFGCIAGFVEHGESAEQCVAREVLEETGITVQDIRYVGSQAWPFPDQLMLAFTAKYKSGILVLQKSELDDGGWFFRDRLPPLPLPGSVAYNLVMGHFTQ